MLVAGPSMSLPSGIEEEFIAISDGEGSHVHYGSAMTSVGGPSSTSPRGVQGSPSKSITVVDVYDLAASIGKDFEKLIQLHGNDSIRSIMPKVISALETLEALAASNEAENEQISNLERTVERLETEKTSKQKDRVKFEEDLEQVEEMYRKEISELRQSVKALMHENRTLSSTVCSMPTHLPDSPTQQHAHDIESMLALKEESHKLKDEIRTLKKELDASSKEVESMQNGIDRLIRQNEELLRKNGSLQKQGRMIVEEKCELVRRLEKTEESNFELRRWLNEKDRACKELEEEASMSDSEPRFTLAELREVLQEKNILKGRVMELEEEIDQMKIKSTLAPPQPKEESEDDGDRPVQGPMPREPIEKISPWKFERKESGVRRFFSFFKDLGGSSPRRGSSSVTNSPRPVRSTTMSSLAAE
ncbi:rilp-1 [Pristionchus pacificus]|uniref:Rilp-1 n=1 Tax=Pristionchus pacificus TaxID=54126 RepID=A0A2A6BPJ6_PRIPA|nr:rilp-1 [Pristionchus pacificus]|eukprot:PDM67872.1 rilp-1 [Pristionchus pacificus]